MNDIMEFYWPENKRPGWALRWSVTPSEAHAEICTSTSTWTDGRYDEDIVLSDGGAGESMPLHGPWKAEFSISVKFDGFARMWCEDLQLGVVGEIDDLADLLRHVYARAEVLIAHAQEEATAAAERWREDAERRQAELWARKGIHKP